MERRIAKSICALFLFKKCGYCNSSAYTNRRILDIIRTRPLESKTSIQGWVKAVRNLKDKLFIDVNDGSTMSKLQVVLMTKKKPKHLGFGASVRAEGKIVENANRQLELQADDLMVVGPCITNDGYPFAGKVLHPPEYVRKYLHLRSRTSSFGSLLRVRSAATKAIHDYFYIHGYTQIHTPIFTSNDCEGAGEIFIVRPKDETFLKTMNKPGTSPDAAYFDTPAFLTVSGQLHLEATARGLGNVYTLGPTFRAENSRSRLHLCEFYMLEAESAFTNNLDELMKIIERFVKHVTHQILNDCEEDVISLQNDMNKMVIKNLLEKPFVTMTYNEACSILKDNHHVSNTVHKGDLSKEQELFLVNHLGEVPVFITEWPRASKPFYMKQISDSKQVAAVDLLVPQIGELFGGGVREDDYDILKETLSTSRLSQPLAWYLDLRKFGNIPTAGFGMGFERYLQLLLGIGNIKDTIPFPRWPHNCKL